MNIDFKLCKEGKLKNIDSSFLIEFKFDGIRCMLIKEGDNIKLINRSLNDITKYFPEVVEEAKMLEKDGKYDGELIIGNYGDFHKIQKRLVDDKKKIELLKKTIPANFMIFDYVNDRTLVERRKELIDLAKFKYICVSPFFYSDKLSVLWKYVEIKGLEGLIAKKKYSYYDSNRDSNWLKIKNKKEDIMDFDDYEKHEAGVLLKKGDLRVNLNGKESKKAIKKMEENGSVKCEVEYLEKEESDKLRQPHIKRVL